MAAKDSTDLEAITYQFYDTDLRDQRCHDDHEHLVKFNMQGIEPEICIVNKTPDMGMVPDLQTLITDHLGETGLTIDFTQGPSKQSLYRCFSREIFGTIDHYGIVKHCLAENKNERKDSEEVYTREVELDEHLPTDQLFPDFPTVADQQQLQEITDWLQLPIFVLLHAFEKTYWLQFHPDPHAVKYDEKQKTCSFYITLLYVNKVFHRIVPDMDTCRCQQPLPRCEGLLDFIANLLAQPDLLPPEMTRRFSDIKICLRKLKKSISHLKKRFDVIDETTETVWRTLEQSADILDKRRKSVNISVLSAQSISIVSGIVGAVFFGLSFTPLAPVAIPVTIAMAAVSTTGGVATGAANTVQIVMDKSQREKAESCFNTLKSHQESFTNEMENIDQLLNQLHEFLRFPTDRKTEGLTSRNIDMISSACFVTAAAFRTAKSATSIAFMSVRTLFASANVVFAVLAPLAFVVDVGILIAAAVDTHKGSKSDLARNLREISANTRAMRGLYRWMLHKYQMILEGNYKDKE